MMYGTDGCMWGGWGWSGWILMGALTVRYLAGSDTERNRADSAASFRSEDALAQRFAQGDIDADEFRRRMTLLRESQESR